MPDPVRDASKTLINRFASRLKFPQLFAFVATLFVIDLIIPDMIPFIDEILLGLVTLLLGSLRNKEPSTGVPYRGDNEKPPMKDVTPEDGAAP